MSFIKAGKVGVIFDGQFGSTGKGSIAAHLAMKMENDVDWAVSNASANAGHWAHTKNADYCTHHLPMFGVIQGCNIYLCAGSIINPDLLLQEIENCGVKPEKVYIHPNAAIISHIHKELEMDEQSSLTAVASTRQGVGAALAAKILRQGNIARDCEKLRDMVNVVDLNAVLCRGARASLEIPQGFSLSINQKFYPYCTSRDCTVVSGLSDAGIHPHWLGQSIMSIRTFPIRVGNIEGTDGAVLGTSGPVYDDQVELDWNELGIIPETTTVTKRQRRVFSFSLQQFKEAVRYNRPDGVFLNFMNYLPKESHEKIIDMVVREYSVEMKHSPNFLYLGHGPTTDDIYRSRRS